MLVIRFVSFCLSYVYYNLSPSIHSSNVRWVHHPLVSNAHLTIIIHASLSCAFLSECIYPRYTISLHRPAILFLVFLFLFFHPSPRTPPPLPVCYLSFYRCAQISLISFP